MRITADIDSKSKLYLIYCLSKAILHIRKIKKIEINKSSKKGYHIIVWTTKRYKKADVYKIRKLIGDDYYRIKFDKVRKIGEQTLFDKKIKLR